MSRSGLLPLDLRIETLQTLALLLPRSNVESKAWFQKKLRRNPGDIDPKAGFLVPSSEGSLQGNRKYWHNRLCIIQKAYDESEPTNLSQFFYDRRRKVQWYTFWIAILILFLTVVFGMIQSVTGVMQVYAAYHAPPSN